MTDVADRHWGQSLVQAPTATAAAHLTGTAAGPAPAPVPRTDVRRPEAESHPRPAVASVAPASPGAVPAASASRLSPVPPSATDPLPVAAASPPRLSPVVPPSAADALPSSPAVLQWPVSVPDAAVPDPPAEPLPDPSLARLARGIQDCARALASMADRLDALERRIDGVATAPATQPVPADPAPSRPGAPAANALDVRVRALEGLSADRLQAVDQRLRRLETLPVAVVRLQQDTASLSELVRAWPPDETADRGSAGPDLTVVYQELDSVAELVSSHHAAATQSLERVRTLERAVLETRRHLERNLAEHTRTATAEQANSRARIERLEARLAEAEFSRPPALP